LAKVEAERQKAEQEARQKAEAEQAALRQSSGEAQRKAAEAEREKAEAEAKLKAEADRVAAKQKEEAEAAEKALRLEQADRERLQVALTSIGFDTRGNDGVFGQRSREMIAGWQKKAGAPATGFVTANQRDQLLRSGAAGIARWEEEQKKTDQKKVDDESKKAGDAKAAAAAAPTASSPAPVAAMPPAPAAPAPSAVASPGNVYDGNYRGEVGDISHEVAVALRITKDSGSGTITGRGCSPSSFSATISYAGDIRAEGDLSCPVRYFNTTYIGRFTFSGRAEGRQIKGSLVTNRGALPIVLYRLDATPAPPQTKSPDGLWRGTYACGAGSSGSVSLVGEAFTLDLTLKLAGGTSSGGGFAPSSSNGRTTNIDISLVSPTGVTVKRAWMSPSQQGSSAILHGQLDGDAIRANGKELGSGRSCTLTLTRVP
jgi:peptidoglycan hydrolase-like protein with peptidoglycan-binding domain